MNSLSIGHLFLCLPRKRKNRTYSLPKERDLTMPLIHFICWKTAESLLTIQNLRPSFQFTLQMVPWIWKSISTDEHEQHHIVGHSSWYLTFTRRHGYIHIFRETIQRWLITKAVHVPIETEDQIRASIKRANISRTKSEHVKCMYSNKKPARVNILYYTEDRKQQQQMSSKPAKTVFYLASINYS